MISSHQIYKCEICGNIVEVVRQGNGTLVCCGQEMKTMPAQTKGEYAEKHAPVVEEVGENRIRVKVGAVEHPMEDDHYIEWIEVITKNNDRVLRKYLKPGQKPEVMFTIRKPEFYVRMYCNIHGLWVNKK